MNSPEIKAFIKANEHLFWYTPKEKKEHISHEFLVETILNYGDLNAIKKLIQIIGTEQLGTIFFNLQGRKKLNYYPEIYHFFSLVFKKYAPGNIQF
jgi:hypothetical protein